jgi:hypothetical protein
MWDQLDHAGNVAQGVHISGQHTGESIQGIQECLLDGFMLQLK